MATDLVTGGAGFIGGHLVAALQRRGRTVRILDLVPPVHAAAVEHVCGSITDPEVVQEAVRGVERVFHVAGIPTLWDGDAESFKRINHIGAEIVFDAAARAGVDRVVLTSSHTVDFQGALPGPYARAKWAAEKAALARAARGEPVVVVKPTLPIGPDDPNLTPPTMMLRDFLNGRHPAYLEFEANLIDVREVAEGHVLAAERGEPGGCYMLGRHNIRMSALLTLLADLTGLPMPRLRVPYALALVAAHAAEAIARLTGRPPDASVEGVRLTRMLEPVSEAPAAALGLEAWPLRQALLDTIRWLCDTGHLTRRPKGG